jgi:cation diffusion facilitator family transporter
MPSHSHTFGQDIPRAGERRTLIVVIITATMMIVEIAAGILYGSMALLADGLHMASHALALTISWAAYIFARKFAHDPKFSFGTGKVNSLAAFSSALLLAVFAIMMAWESVDRFLNPVEIQYTQAILVAIIGLIVNGASVFILGFKHDHGHDHGHQHHDHDHHEHHHHEDHNLRAAYFHVLADALTSILAIAALLAAKFYGLTSMDPMMGIVGAILVARWSVGLLKESGRVLLDRQAPSDIVEHIIEHIEHEPGSTINDLHVWSIGPGIYACELCVTSKNNLSAAHYKSLLPNHVGIVHATVEVHQEKTL